MKKLKLLFVFGVLMSEAACQPIRQVDVTVLSDNGNPVQGAEVVVWFYGYQPEQSKSEQGLTDRNGRFKASGRPHLGMLVRINKEGYYETEKDKLSITHDHKIELVLREKKNPIPLFAKRVRDKVPGISEPFGFDLRMGDWVKPFGVGEVSDMFFTVTKTKSEDGVLGGILSVTFPEESEGVYVINSLNGYLPLSKMVMPNYAPDAPYLNMIERVEFGYQNHKKPLNTSYFLRTRMQKADEDEPKYNFSKMLDGIYFHMGGGEYLEEPGRSRFPDEYGAVVFTYYFNPNPSDRNLEFNPSMNLFEIQDYSERVLQP